MVICMGLDAKQAQGLNVPCLARASSDVGTPNYIPSNFAAINQILGRIWVIKSVRGQNKEQRRKAAVLRAQRNSNDQQFQHFPCRDCNN